MDEESCLQIVSRSSKRVSIEAIASWRRSFSAWVWTCCFDCSDMCGAIIAIGQDLACSFAARRLSEYLQPTMLPGHDSGYMSHMAW